MVQLLQLMVEDVVEMQSLCCSAGSIEASELQRLILRSRLQ